MAVSHYGFNESTPHGRALRDALTKLEEGAQELKDHRDAMVQMQDGGVFTSYAVGLYGFADVAAITAAFGEIDSVNGKLTTNAEVTAMADALTQLFARLR